MACAHGLFFFLSARAGNVTVRLSHKLVLCLVVESIAAAWMDSKQSRCSGTKLAGLIELSSHLQSRTSCLQVPLRFDILTYPIIRVHAGGR